MPDYAWFLSSDPGRFWAMVDQSGGSDACWPWTGKTYPNGYGAVERRVNGARYATLAHRAAWMLAYGAVPAGAFVCHSCDVRACCNPDHLWVGTHADNMRDMAAKGRANHRSREDGGRWACGAEHGSRTCPDRWPRGEAVGTSRLTVADVLAIREMHTRGVPRREIAVRFGIHRCHVSAITARRAWRHVR